MGLYSRFILPRIFGIWHEHAASHAQRPRALAEARGDVLEIGFGTGLNLASYPPGVEHLIVVDPVEMLAPRVAPRIAAAAMPVTIERADAATLPFDAGRFDCVVSTWTLCTIPDVEKSLGEIRRVLKPSGRFLFLEHGRSEKPGLARWQDRLDRLHGLFTGGCHVNREIDRLVTGGGLVIQRLERFELAGTPRYMASHYLGSATVA